MSSDKQEQISEEGCRPLEQEALGEAERRRLSGPGLRTSLNVAKLWSLTDEQFMCVLGGQTRSRLQSWIAAAREQGELLLDDETLLRLSAFLGVYEGLQILHRDEADGQAWLLAPHQAAVFGGRRPIDLVTSGSFEALLSVRRFLDAARGGLYMSPNELDRAAPTYRDVDIRVS